MDWHHYLKRYLWDENKTPFFVAVGGLGRGQADREIFLYALFLSVPSALLLASVLSYSLRHGLSSPIWAGAYALSVFVAAAWLHLRKSLAAACYSATAPLVLGAYVLLQGFHPSLGTVDQVLLVAVLLLWLRYIVRVAAIARRYPSMPERPPGG